MNFSNHGEDQEQTAIELTSLIDVMFTLVLFFMITTTFISAPGFKVDLPKSSAADIQREKKDLTIVIGQDQSLFLNQKKMTEEELQEKLSQEAKKNSQTLVIIQADQNISHGTVVKIMDVARDAGLNRLAIATAAKGQGPLPSSE